MRISAVPQTIMTGCLTLMGMIKAIKPVLYQAAGVIS